VIGRRRRIGLDLRLVIEGFDSLDQKGAFDELA
jgi:hypothetical protein